MGFALPKKSDFFRPAKNRLDDAAQLRLTLALPTNGGRSDGRIESGKGVAMARKKYTKEFKEQACRLVLNGTHTPTEAAHELGLLRETLLGWIKRAGLRPPGRQPLDLGSDDPAALKIQMKALQKRLQQAEMERDILKKATAFFASQNP
jgi:transposase